MGMEHLSAQLQAVVRRMDEGVGFRVTERKRGDLFKIITKKFDFTLIIVNPEEQEVIILGEEEMFREPKIWLLEGANFGGSMVKVGYVLTGCYLKIRSLSEGGYGLLPMITDFAEFEGEVTEETSALIEKAEASRPRQATPDEIEDMKNKFWEIFDSHSWGDQREAVREMIGRFCFLNGQAYILGIFLQALEAGKVPAALEVLEKQWKEHWYFRPDKFRGEIITPSDDHYLRMAYVQLGLTPVGEVG